MTRVIVTATVALLLAACGAPTGGDNDAGDGGAPWREADQQDFPLALGTGDAAFVVLDEGDPLPLVRGFQGLQHVAASLRVWDIPAERYLVAVELWRMSDGAPVGEPARTRVPLTSAPGEDYLEIVGLRAVVRAPADVVGEEALLRVRVEGPDDLVASVSHAGVVEWASE